MENGLFIAQHSCCLPGLCCDSLYPYGNRCRIDFRFDYRCGIPYEILYSEGKFVVLTIALDSEKVLG